MQALLLYAITMHAAQRPTDAASCVSRAATIAISLGMNDECFAKTRSFGSEVLEESLRRTWWELHTVDVYFAALHRRSTYETSAIQSFPLLPCTQALYECGQCEVEPRSLEAFNDRVFSITDSELHFSSACFRIEAVRVVERVLTLAASNDATPDDVQALDNAIASWDFNLPVTCKDMLGPSGEIDHMLFEARCLILCANIFLHFPRSELPATVPSAGDLDCAKDYTPLAPTSRHHALKAIAASKELSNLATLPWPVEHQSPFFICGLVLGCIVQLAAGTTHVQHGSADCLQQLRERVVLMLGALQRLGEVWPLASNAVRALRPVAETVFTRRKQGPPSSNASSFHDSVLDINTGDASDMLWFDLLAGDNLPNVFFNA